MSTSPGIYCVISAAHSAWCLGYPAQARRLGDETIRLAQQLAHPETLVATLYQIARLRMLCTDLDKAHELSEALMEQATEQAIRWWIANATFLRGWILAEQGQKEAGVEQIRQGLVNGQTTGGKIAKPMMMTILAKAAECTPPS